jgi:dihydroxyacid dehydratase/phosphogluconate dehydratase
MESNKEKAKKKKDTRTTSLNTEYGHRVIFKAMGFTSEELSLPRIAVVKRRRVKWTPPDQSKVTGTLAIYAKTALQADQGAGWPARMSDFDTE